MEINTNVFGSNIHNARRKKFGIGSLLVLIFLGVAFWGIGLGIYNTAKIDPSWTRINGTVVGVNNVSSSNGTTYAPTVSYQVNNQTYKITSGSSSSSYPSIGSVRQVAYDPSNPGHAKVVESGSVVAIILLFPVLGALMLVLAPILFVRSLLRSKDIHKLKQTGQRVQGVITDIQTMANNNSNQGGSSYRITVSATGLDGNVQNYVSDWMSGIGGLAMADFRNNPIPMDVYINPATPQDYYVDISEVPNLTPERIMELITSGVHSYRPTSINPVTAPGTVATVGQPSVSPPLESQQNPDPNQSQNPPQS